MLLKNVLNRKYYLLLDQALVSLLNFGSLFLFSKFATIVLFANFVLAYSYSNLIFILGTYFLSTPVLVLLPKKPRIQNTTYLALILLFAFILVLLASALCYPLMRMQISESSFILFFTMTFMMVCFDLLKKFVFAKANIKFINTLLPTLILVALFFLGVFVFSQQLTLNLIFTIYSISFFVASIVLLIYFKYERLFNVSKIIINKNLSIGYLKEHYVFAKWIIIGGILFWAYSQGIYILAEFLGVNEFGLGKVRTIQNLLGLFSILIISMENHFLPQFSRNVANLNHHMKLFYVKYSWAIIVIFLVSIPVVYYVYELFYKDKYGDGTLIMGIIWLTQLLIVFLRPFAISLKAKEITYPLFFSHFAAIVSMLTVGVLLIVTLNLVGVAITIFMAYLVSNIVILRFYKKT